MMKKKRAVTLLEMMVVIFLIGIITTVIGFNMRGSLEEGKAFKSKQGAERLADILNLQIAKSTEWSAKNLIENKGEVERCLKNSKLVKNVEEFLKTAVKTKPLICYCYHGISRQGAAEFFKHNGFQEAYSIQGGFEAWKGVYPFVSGS